MDEYINTPTRVRLFQEDDGDWSIDGVDDSGNYTERCWTFGTRSEAESAVADFAAIYQLDPSGVEVIDQ